MYYINIDRTKGANMKEFRIKCGYSQKQLADKLFLSQRAISAYEKGDREPNFATIIKLAKILNCSVEDIVRCFAN